MRSLTCLMLGLLLASALAMGCSGSKSTAPMMTSVDTSKIGKAPQPPAPPPPPPK